MIKPISSRDPTNRTAGSNRTEGVTQGEVTAAKVKKIPLPVIEGGLRGRKFTLLDDAKQLSRKIRSDWNLLDPQELAEKIIELEGKVSLIQESGPEIEKIKDLAEHLHFKFVFPVALEIETTSISFAKTIYKLANQILKTGSVEGFEGLNRIQKQEILRLAGRNE